MQRKLFLILLLGLVLLIATGCEDKEGILEKYPGGRLGVILETDLTSYRSRLSGTLIDYIKRRVEMEVVDPQLLTPSGEYYAESTHDYYRDRLGLDFLLVVKLQDLSVEEKTPSIHLWSKHVDIEVSTSASLTLAYILHDLHGETVINLGQSNGSARESTEAGAGEGGIHFKFEQIDQFKLIEEAMLDALRKTELL